MGQSPASCDLSEPIGISQPTVSQHLEILVIVGLLRREYRDVSAYCDLDDDALRQLAEVVAPPRGGA